MPEDTPQKTAQRPTLMETVAGQDRVFSFPDSYDKIALIAEYQKFRKGQFLDNMKLTDTDPEQQRLELHEFDSAPPLDWPNFFKTERGRLFGFELSLRPVYGKVEAEAITREIDWPEGKQYDLTIKLWKLTVVDPNATQGNPSTEQQAEPGVKQPDNRTYGDGAGEPNPPKPPPVYGTIPEAAKK